MWFSPYSYRQRYASSQIRSKFVVDSQGHNILTTVMTNIVVDKSKDDAKPHAFDLLIRPTWTQQ